ncbi:DUF3626 domain-containing protein [Streptomyces xiaopingdaonensis]|uniref:DUF3626 domain-containing protein n=1 Tax=Streptomyces xiaopingdaonensis TaxID=1565415 RepID=UPI000365B9F4|nr:DUF3626 domain-containing protein [Streptomyces xiaopingdaonensis]
MAADILLPLQRCALAHVAAVAAGPPVSPDARITVNFHPDRPARGATVVEALAESGVYLSQFVTETSNGGLTAYPGGDRWRWESQMFGGAYDHAPPAARPVYGALDQRRLTAGAAPRFGSAHLRLTAGALRRSTFCYPDSAFGPTLFGTAERLGPVALDRSDGRDALDDYVEAHVHGSVRLDRDVEALVLDPCHRGTALEPVARRLPCPVEWHAGFRLTVDELRRRPGYRGQRIVEAAEEIAADGVLDPRLVGEAAVSGRHEPRTVKKVWHCVARFGSPDAAGSHRAVSPPST